MKDDASSRMWKRLRVGALLLAMAAMLAAGLFSLLRFGPPEEPVDFELNVAESRMPMDPYTEVTYPEPLRRMTTPLERLANQLKAENNRRAIERAIRWLRNEAGLSATSP